MTKAEAIKYIKARCIGSAEERDGTQWSDAMWTAIEALSAEAVQGECRTCKRSSDYLWKNGENGTRCPIEEHYALPKDGYCHLYDPYKGGEEE